MQSEALYLEKVCRCITQLLRHGAKIATSKIGPVPGCSSNLQRLRTSLVVPPKHIIGLCLRVPLIAGITAPAFTKSNVLVSASQRQCLDAASDASNVGMPVHRLVEMHPHWSVCLCPRAGRAPPPAALLFRPSGSGATAQAVRPSWSASNGRADADCSRGTEGPRRANPRAGRGARARIRAACRGQCTSFWIGHGLQGCLDRAVAVFMH